MKKALLLAFILLTGFGFVVVALKASNGNRREDIATAHISAKEVSLSNLSVFEAQMRRELPVGTVKQHVETYLSQQSIPHFFANSNSSIGGNTFYATLSNIGTYLGFPASLAIRIHLNQRERVDRIEFRVDYDAP